MIIKKHLCGVAVAYDPIRRSTGKYETKIEGRPQGSRYSQQKRKIADACEYLRLYSIHKPRIFVATSPNFLDHAKEGNLISKLCANLRNGYGCEKYVWVREFTKLGYPHYHFVADIPQFDAVKLSLYWSGLFGSNANNSIRLGTNPDRKTGKRKFWLSGRRHAWYLGKYLGKSVAKCESGLVRRSFAISPAIGRYIEPLIYQAELSEWANKPIRNFVMTPECFDREIELREEQIPNTNFNPKEYSWTWTGHSRTYSGVPKEWYRKAKK